MLGELIKRLLKSHDSRSRDQNKHVGWKMFIHSVVSMGESGQMEGKRLTSHNNLISWQRWKFYKLTNDKIRENLVSDFHLSLLQQQTHVSLNRLWTIQVMHSCVTYLSSICDELYPKLCHPSHRGTEKSIWFLIKMLLLQVTFVYSSQTSVIHLIWAIKHDHIFT